MKSVSESGGDGMMDTIVVLSFVGCNGRGWYVAGEGDIISGRQLEIYDNKERECKKLDDVVSLLPSVRQIDFVAKPLRKRSNRLQA